MAVSTGADLQQSSRLLSAVNATGLAILPSAKQLPSQANGRYTCDRGETEVVLLSDDGDDIQHISPEKLAEMTHQYSTSAIDASKAGCSGACGDAGKNSNEQVKEKEKFGVYCITVSDRAA